MSTVAGRAHPAADALSLALNPSVWGGGFVAFLALHLEGPGAVGIRHAILAFCFTGAVPVAVLFVLKAAGRVTDVELRTRSDRRLVYRVCIASYLLGALVLARTGAVWPVWGAVAAHVPPAIVLALLNRRSKVSIHTTGLSGVLAVALVIFGAAAWPLALVTVAGAAARWAAGAHSLAELAGGTAVGLVMTTAGFLLIGALAGA